MSQPGKRDYFYSAMIFRRFLLTILTAVCLCTCGNQGVIAQTSLGLHGGVNFAKMDFTRNPDFRGVEIQMRQGFQFGVFYRLMSRQLTGIAFELNYSQQGWNEGVDTTAATRYQRQIDYITLPLLTHFNIGKDRFRVLIEIGPYVGYAMQSSEIIVNNNTGAAESLPYEYSEELDNRIDFGLIIGGGFEYHLGAVAFQGVARYGYGLGNIFQKRGDAAELSQNRVITVMAGIVIPLRKTSATPRTDRP